MKMMDRFENNMILYRPVGLQELALIYDSGMKAFPGPLPQQPIFYPVLDLEYARQIASEWNTSSGQSAGYVTQFKVEEEYIGRFEEHTVRGTQHQEFWIPAEELEEFNRHITGHIKVVEAHFGDAFEGFVPEQFGLQGKNAVAQFTLLANSFLYKRMDFYLEIRRNHKAIFLNYPFWQTYDFKNPGLKEKVLQAMREAWLTSFPHIPLPLPPLVHEDILPVEQTDADAHPQRPVDPAPEDIPPIKPKGLHSLLHPVHEEPTPVEQSISHASIDPEPEDIMPVEQTEAHAHFAQGVTLGLSGRYHEARDELSNAVEEDPEHVVALTSLGVAFHRLGEDDRALSCYEAALRMDPISAEAHYFRANLLYSQGNVREAIAGYTIAIGLKPELIEAHQKPLPHDRLTDYSPSPAEMYWIAKPAHRILDLNKLLETTAGQASLFKERAAEYYRLRNYVQAVADYSSSLERGPDDASLFHLRGVAYEQLGQLDRALEDYQRAMAINPQISNEYINRGVAFGNVGNFRQSIASLSEAIRLAPGNPDGYFNRGTAYLRLGDFENAIDDFSNVIRLSPGDEEAYYRRGISSEEAGHQSEAIADYRQFLALSRDASAREEIERKLSQWDEAQRSSVSSRTVVAQGGQKTGQVPAEEPAQDLDLYGLIAALGERALDSIWFGSGVSCDGEKAEELYALTDQNKPIEGRDLLHLTSGIRQMTEGDFQAFDPGATSHWVLIRAWEGSGFYIETNDSNIKERLKTHFQSVEEVEGAVLPYAGFFIRIYRLSH